MKGIATLLIFGVVIVGILFYIQTNVGDVRPVLLPAAKPKKITPIPLKQGKALNIQLSIADGFQVGYFSENVGSVRDLVFSPGGVLLASIPSEGKIVMLPDRDNNGIADEVTTIIGGLQRPHGIAFYNNYLYVAEETKVSRYIWSDQKLIGGIARLDKKLFDLPKGDRHFTRSIAFDKKGTMYISLGSTCDVCYEKQSLIASVIVSDYEGRAPQVFAKGLRNSPFIIVNPKTEELWGTEMGRDFLGDNLPPDEINIIKSSNNSSPANYGWPICYGNKIHDSSFDKNVYVEDPCLNTIAPIYEIPAHSAPLGLTFINSKQFPGDWQGDLLVAYHGSWNRSSPIGYKVVHIHVDGDKIITEEDFLKDFLVGNEAFARPVDVVFDKNGYLYISDDKAGNIFIVSKKD